MVEDSAEFEDDCVSAEYALCAAERFPWERACSSWRKSWRNEEVLLGEVVAFRIEAPEIGDSDMRSLLVSYVSWEDKPLTSHLSADLNRCGEKNFLAL